MAWGDYTSAQADMVATGLQARFQPLAGLPLAGLPLAWLPVRALIPQRRQEEVTSCPVCVFGRQAQSRGGRGGG